MLVDLKVIGKQKLIKDYNIVDFRRKIRNANTKKTIAQP